MQKAETCRRTRTEGPEQAFDGSGMDRGPGPCMVRTVSGVRFSGSAAVMPSCRAALHARAIQCRAVPCKALPCHASMLPCCRATTCQGLPALRIAMHCSAMHAAVVMPCRCCTWQAINRHAVLPYDHITAQQQHNAALCYAVPQQQEKHCLQFLAMHHAAAVN